MRWLPQNTRKDDMAYIIHVETDDWPESRMTLGMCGPYPSAADAEAALDKHGWTLGDHYWRLNPRPEREGAAAIISDALATVHRTDSLSRVTASS